MGKAKVSIIRADDYDRAEIYAALKKSMQLLGGLGKIISRDSKVFVKINHISPSSPAEKGLVTHPIFVEAVVNVVKELTDDITVGDDIDSSGDGFQVSGFRQMCNRSGVKLVNLRDAGFVETICNGHFLKKVYLSKDVLDADVIINLPKLKTHSLCILTCGVKNLYGIIPLGHRSKYHSEYARNEYFSQVLTDIFSIAMPQLTIVDGIIAMEGEGPAAGSLRKLGIILASQDTVAVDAVATNIMGLNPTDIYTTLYSDERGLGEGTLENIEIVGEELEGVVVPDFKPPSSAVNTLSRRLDKALPRFIIRQLSLKPNVITSLCTGCSECEKICPVGAAKVSGKKAQINHSICVQCMCCHEVCRFNAIQLKRSVTGTLINFVIKMAKRLLLSKG